MRALLSLSVLGPLRTHRDGALLTLKYNKARLLLAWLVFEPGYHTRDALADLLWPDVPTQSGRDRLKRMLFHLRDVLGDDVIDATRTVVRIDPQAALWLDAFELAERTDAVAPLPDGIETPLTAQQLDTLDHAVKLYRGPFLQGLDIDGVPALESWIRNHRDAHAQRVTRALRDLARGHAHRGELSEALRHARRLTAHRPFEESGWQLLLALLVEAGMHDEARIELKRCADALSRGLDALPAPETVALVAGAPAGRAPRILPAMSDVRRRVAIVRCDLQPRATSDPEDMLAMLAPLFDACARDLRRAGGFIDESSKSGVTAYFGFPLSIELAVTRALGASLDLLHALRRLPRFASGDVVARIGLHAAVVVASTEERVPDRVGFATRMAERLASRAPEGQVLVSALARRIVGEAFECDLFGVIGDDAQHIYQVRRAPRGTPPRVQLIGRDADLKVIDDARATHPALLICGDPGIGKTALARTWRGERQAPGPDFNCLRERATDPLHPFEPWLQRQGLELPEGVNEAGAMLRAALERVLPAGGTVWIDNLQFADDATLDFIGSLIDAPLAGHFMLMTARSAFHAPWKSEHLATHALDPLDDAATRALIGQLADEAPRDFMLDAGASACIAARSDGVPLFVEELMRAYREEAESPESAVPHRLYDTLAERIDATRGAKPILQIAASIGRTFDADVLAAALDTTRPALRGALDALIGHGLLCHRDGSRYAFRYALLREAAYESQTRDARAQVQARIAQSEDAVRTLRKTAHPDYGPIRRFDADVDD